ncbi:hypothetical protein IEQ34_026940 [Dendrobium chrysotoxum]|uniref:Uncharacterized protein n=1 Tax=Dendrobium chrysotoxum TaxID=161865 RepID=A0AAV7FIC7_DENCH|nr:hypothetical protein IEQ34_026940 [Dendrobium chrysotoxum]
MGTATIIRAGSIYPCSDISTMFPRSPAGGNETSVSFHRRNLSTRLSLDLRERRDLPSPTGKMNPLRRVRSDTDLIGSTPLSPRGARSSTPATLAEVEEANLVAGGWNRIEVVEEELLGGGKGNGKKSAGGSGSRGRDNGDQDIGSYYQERLRADSGNPLLLTNYGRFLHEVEEDFKKAEEYYSRAILVSPDDGEVISLYGRLLWESQRDCKRAEAYYGRAVAASPDDCYVLGSYAHFLWDTEDEEEEGRVALSSPLVEAL